MGAGNDLVDFYLPDYATWIEAKGQFEARDDFLLKEVAHYLKEKRQQRLFIYTSGKPILVTATEFQKITRDEMWKMILG